MKRTYTAFAGHRLIGQGTLEDVVLASKAAVEAGETERVALFEDATGRAIDVDLRGSGNEVLARLEQHPLCGEPAATPSAPRGRGRPKLGVVSREISLLPRHWDWLASQKGGASAAIRRLVDQARRDKDAAEQARRAKDGLHRFMWDMAGDLPGFEEASRSFWASDYLVFGQQIASWPEDVRAYVERLLARLLDLEKAAAQ